MPTADEFFGKEPTPLVTDWIVGIYKDFKKDVETQLKRTTVLLGDSFVVKRNGISAHSVVIDMCQLWLEENGLTVGEIKSYPGNTGNDRMEIKLANGVLDKHQLGYQWSVLTTERKHKEDEEQKKKQLVKDNLLLNILKNAIMDKGEFILDRGRYNLNVFMGEDLTKSEWEASVKFVKHEMFKLKYSVELIPSRKTHMRVSSFKDCAVERENYAKKLKMLADN